MTTWCYLVADETRLSANELASPDARQGTFANTIAPIFSLLQDNYAVARYDTRGISRSRLDNPSEDIPVVIHADDARRMLAEFGDEPAAVFGRSGRAVIGLALNQRYPEQVWTLVPHEPPLVHLLSEADARRTAVQDTAWSLVVREGRVVGPNAPTAGPPPLRGLRAPADDCLRPSRHHRNGAGGRERGRLQPDPLAILGSSWRPNLRLQNRSQGRCRAPIQDFRPF